MNPAHLHLVLNHLPPVGVLFGILLLVAASYRKSDELTRAGLGLFVVVALLAFPTYFTGEPAEDAIGHLPGVSKDLIETHEDAALTTLIAVEILGVVSLLGLAAYRRHAPPKWFVAASLALSILVGGMLGRTADLGGQIRHSEIRDRFSDPLPVETEAGPINPTPRDTSPPETPSD